MAADVIFQLRIHRPHHVGPLVSTLYLLIINSSSLPLLVSIDLGVLVYLVSVFARILYFITSFVLRKTFSTNMLCMGSLVLIYFRIIRCPFFFSNIIPRKTYTVLLSIVSFV